MFVYIEPTVNHFVIYSGEEGIKEKWIRRNIQKTEAESLRETFEVFQALKLSVLWNKEHMEFVKCLTWTAFRVSHTLSILDLGI